MRFLTIETIKDIAFAVFVAIAIAFLSALIGSHFRAGSGIPVSKYCGSKVMVVVTQTGDTSYLERVTLVEVAGDWIVLYNKDDGGYRLVPKDVVRTIVCRQPSAEEEE